MRMSLGPHRYLKTAHAYFSRDYSTGNAPAASKWRSMCDGKGAGCKSQARAASKRRATRDGGKEWAANLKLEQLGNAERNLVQYMRLNWAKEV